MTRPVVEAPVGHGWADHGACRTATPEQADALTEVTTLAEAAPLVARWCAGCPVKALCEAQGRSTRASGLWGGQVLLLGRTSQDRRPRAPQPRVIPVRVAGPPSPNRSTLGQPPRGPRITPAEQDAIRLHLSRGLSAYATARTVGVNRSTVKALVEREGLEAPGVRQCPQSADSPQEVRKAPDAANDSQRNKRRSGSR